MKRSEDVACDGCGIGVGVRPVAVRRRRHDDAPVVRIGLCERCLTREDRVWRRRWVIVNDAPAPSGKRLNGSSRGEGPSPIHEPSDRESDRRRRARRSRTFGNHPS